MEKEREEVEILETFISFPTFGAGGRRDVEGWGEEGGQR